MDFSKLKTSKSELVAIHRIAKRAIALGLARTLLDTVMDLEAAHSVTPLDLSMLEQADSGDFMHDVYGICAHLDRDTGKLMDCFLPRYALANTFPEGTDPRRD